MLDLATEMAHGKHKDQKWAGGLPYVEHLRRVDVMVAELAKDLAWPDVLSLRCAAWLHDSVEDTDMTVPEIKSALGETIAQLVWAVTNEPGKNRSERHLKTYPKIKSVKYATLLKLADRIVNVEASIGDPDFLSMYRKEYVLFRSSLYVEGEYQHAWDRLEKLFECS